MLANSPRSNTDRSIIAYARKSLLFDSETPWCKRNNTLFDAAMGSYDGAEVCELVGLLILQNLPNEFNNKLGNGLYWDDGLAVFRNMGPRTADKVRKRFCETFSKLGLKITVQSNLKIVNFLDITLDLAKDKFSPFRKPDNPTLYINVQWNHPPTIIKHLPAAIGSRISSLSCDQAEFHKAAPAYNRALKAGGYREEIHRTEENTKKKRRNRPRNISWFDPLFSRNVQTNVGKTFLQLIDKHFPRSNPLHKIFNRGTVKVSYSCMESMKSVINRHNSKVLRQDQRTEDEPEKKCKCRKKEECPLKGQCLTSSIVYRATVTTNDQEQKHYIGMTESNFKSRFRNHKMSFNNKKYSSSTSLSAHI